MSVCVIVTIVRVTRDQIDLKTNNKLTSPYE